MTWRTVQLDDVIQVGEYVFDVSRGQYIVPSEFLVEHAIQDLQHAHVCSLRVEQLWEGQW